MSNCQKSSDFRWSRFGRDDCQDLPPCLYLEYTLPAYACQVSSNILNTYGGIIGFRKPMVRTIGSWKHRRKLRLPGFRDLSRRRQFVRTQKRVAAPPESFLASTHSMGGSPVGFRDLFPSLVTLDGIVGTYSPVPSAGQRRRYCLYAHTQKRERMSWGVLDFLLFFLGLRPSEVLWGIYCEFFWLRPSEVYWVIFCGV